VLWSAEGKASLLVSIGRYVCWSSGSKLRSSTIYRESNSCAELLLSEIVLDIVCNNGDEGLGEFLTTIVKLSMRGSNCGSACVPPTIPPLEPPTVRKIISAASTASRGGYIPRATLLESRKYAHPARGSTVARWGASMAIENPDTRLRVLMKVLLGQNEMFRLEQHGGY
jgi:hypothetical protein